MKIQVRDAVKKDIEGIMEIYNEAIRNTTAIWNDVEVDVDNRLAWLEDRQRAGYPVLVAVDEYDTVLGYASFGDWRAWDGYQYTVEHSVYTHKDHRGLGVGTKLMSVLIARARSLGKHIMIAGIEAENVVSIKLHKKLGFQHSGHLREVGTKFGKWLDLAFLQLTLDIRKDPTDKTA